MVNELNSGSFAEMMKTIYSVEDSKELKQISVSRAKLKELTEERGCKFVLFNGNKRLIKREPFSKYLEEVYSI